MSTGISGADTSGPELALESGAIVIPASGPVAVPDLIPQITAALNTIDRIKRDPEFSKRIADTIGPVITPFIQPMSQPMANIKRALLNSVTTLVPAPATAPDSLTVPGKVAITKKKSTKTLRGGMFTYGTTRGGVVTKLKKKKTKIPLAPAPVQMIQKITPSGLDRALTSLTHIEANLATVREISTAVASINTNLSELVELTKAATPAATASTNSAGNNSENTTGNTTENNSLEGGRRRRRSQTKGKRRGARRTRR